MLATLTDEPFDRVGWLFEIKWDGYRAIAETGHNIRLVSRTGQDFSQRFHSITNALATVNRHAVLDGEIVAIDKQGKPNFQDLQNYANTKTELRYYVFDLLWLDGQDLQPLPLLERKKMLEKILPESNVIKYSEHIEQYGKQLFSVAQQQGLEGIMGKDARSPYKQNYRGPEWLKFKTHKRQEAIICGYTKPKGGRQFFGSLVLGVYHNGRLEYVGNSGSGFNHTSLKTVSALLKPLVLEKSPFNYKVTALAPITWVQPKLICKVEFSEWTHDGQMRHPIFQGLRSDKQPTDVTREIEIPVNQPIRQK